MLFLNSTATVLSVRAAGKATREGVRAVYIVTRSRSVEVKSFSLLPDETFRVRRPRPFQNFVKTLFKRARRGFTGRFKA